jgi:competence protein ComEC
MRLPFWALIFAIGVLLGVTGPPWLSWCLSVLGALGGLWLSRRRWWVLCGADLAFLLGITHGGVQTFTASQREKGLTALAASTKICVLGNVVGKKPAAAVEPPIKAQAVRFEVWGKLAPVPEGIKDVPMYLHVLYVPEYGEPFDSEIGDAVRFCGVWQPPFGFFNPGAGAGWPQVALKSEAGSLRAVKATVLKTGSIWWPTRVAAAVRLALSESFNSLSVERSSFLRATVLGERSAVDSQIELGFKAAGATHALSVSGLHLAAVAALFFVGLRRLLLVFPAVALALPVERLSAALSIPTVVFYTLITGEAVATWRSALMACCVFGGYLLQRKPSIAASIGFAGGLIVLSSAFWLWDVSFQLSIVSVAGLALFSARLGPSHCTQQSALGRCRDWFAKGLAATAAAGLLTAPLVAYHFGEITPAAPIGNLVLTPLVEVLLVPLGLVGACLSVVFPSAAAVLLWPANVSALITIHAAKFFGRFAPVWHVNPPGLWSTLAIMVGLACGLWALGQSGISRKRWSLAAVALLSVAAVVWQVNGWQTRHQDTLRVTFLDVGQGDAAVVQGPRGFVAVVDGGGIGPTYDTGERLLVPFMRREGISHVDLVVLSHPHPDHALGLFAVLKNFKVASLWMPMSADGPDHDGFFIKGLTELAKANGVEVPRPKAFSRGALSIEPMGPWQGDEIAAPVGLSVNDASLSVKVTLGRHSVLFAGDLEGPGELELSERARLGLLDPRSDVLKVPHHGSRTSSSDALLEAAKPSLTVVSAGRGNRFGFPHKEVLDRYTQRNIETLRTDRDGAVQLEWGMDTTMSRTCWRPNKAPCEGI